MLARCPHCGRPAMSLWQKVYYASPFRTLRCRNCGGCVREPFLPSMLAGIPGTLFVLLILAGRINTFAQLVVGALLVMAAQIAWDLLLVPLVKAGPASDRRPDSR